MKKLIVLMATVVFLVPILLGAINSRADEGTFLNHIIPVPGFTDFTDRAHPHGGSFDISFVDSDFYYLADRGFATGHAPGRIDVFDALNDTYLYSIPGFVGNHGSAGGPDPTTGPNGILVLHTHKGHQGELWAGDGDSTVKVVDLEKKIIVATIPTGVPSDNRADELAYDPIHGIIIVANDLPGTPPGSKDPWVTFISQKTRNVLGTILYDGSCTAAPCPKGKGPKAVDGLEQPVFDRGLFFLAVPETADWSGGEIDVIDPVKEIIVNRFLMPAGCNPHGLALGPKHQLCVGCSNSTAPTTPLIVIIDDTNGSVVATFNQLGGSDEVWFNKGDYRYYLAASNNPATNGGPVLGVIDAKTNQWVENLPGGPGAHSVAANPTNNHIFFPLTIPNAAGYSGTPNVAVPPLLQKTGLGLGIAVFEHEDEFKDEFKHEK
jgi:hypothetical protein